MNSSIIYFAVVTVALFWIYKKFSAKKVTLDSMGIAHDKPLPIVGNSLPIALKRQNFVELGDYLYEKFADKK